MRHQKGFTLIELMVVVAIIGLISAVAVPTFKKYQAKAKVIEAKLSLVAIYTVQMTRYSEVGNYTLCFRNHGYQAGNSPRYYTVGWFGLINPASDYVSDHLGCFVSDCSLGSDTDSLSCATTTASGTLITSGNGMIAKLITDSGEGPCTKPAPYSCDITSKSFEAAALGIVSSINKVDHWVINEKKIFTHRYKGF